MLTRLSGVSDRGRKLRLAGRGRDEEGLTAATAGATGALGIRSTSMRGDSRFSESSSSSSSSTRVCSWSFEDEADVKCLKESRLLPIMVLSATPKLGPEPGGNDGFVGKSNIFFSISGVEISGISTLE